VWYQYRPVKTRITLILVLVVVAALMASCGGTGRRDEIVAAFYPVAFAAAEISGRPASVVDLTPSGAEPHDIELKPSDVARIGKARLVLYFGAGFQPAVEKAVATTHVRSIDLLAGQRLAAERGEDGAPTLDPHVWLDPERYAQIARVIGHALGRERSARLFGARLRRLDAAYGRGLEHCSRRTIVTSHAAFGYLARRYGLRQLALEGLTPEAEPSPRALTELIHAVQRSGATTVFFETLASPKLAETVARNAHVETAVLDPIEGLTPDAISHGATYFSVMLANLRALRAALGCR
jgi:zinc transport system substrate-binding protein